jgi:hypothetical protein
MDGKEPSSPISGLRVFSIDIETKHLDGFVDDLARL